MRDPRSWIVAGLLALCACAADDWRPAQLGWGRTSAERATLRRGRDGYGRYCAGCHGERGDGKGPAARFLDPKPRDFRRGMVKFASVPAGELPREEDLLRTMRHGLQGTAMPAWRFVPEEEQRDIVAYLKTFYEGWASRAPGAAISVGRDPFHAHPERGAALGERVYHGLAQCASCHPAYVERARLVEHASSFGITVHSFRDHLYDAVPKPSDWGAPIRPPDFLFDRVKGGGSPEDLARVIAAGVGGTAMPSWGQSLDERQLWGLAHYVASLVAIRGTPRARTLRERLADQPSRPPEDAR